MQDKPAEKARAKNKAPKETKKKTYATELFALEESKVELDSLGSFFVHLIDADSSQDDAETSQAKVEEVTIISSASEPLPRQKVRQVTQIVRFFSPFSLLGSKLYFEETTT